MKKVLALLLLAGCAISLPKEPTFDPTGISWNRNSLPLHLGFSQCIDHCQDYSKMLVLGIKMFNKGAGCELFRYEPVIKNDDEGYITNVDVIFTSLPRKDDYVLDARWQGNMIELGYMSDTEAYIVIAHNLGELMGLAHDPDNNSIMMDHVVDQTAYDRRYNLPIPTLTDADAQALHDRYCK